LVYDSSVRGLLTLVVLTAGLAAPLASAQASAAWQKAKTPKSEPNYTDTFSGTIIELSSEKLAVSRSILGKPAETQTFSIKPDTRVEGKLRLKARVTIGFVNDDDGHVARLIVVRTSQKSSQEKKK
jgi:hypothetical protein